MSTREVNCFVFASPEEISPVVSGQLIEEMKNFLKEWTSHGIPVKAEIQWERNHFMVVKVNESHELPGGCSKDHLFRKVRELENKYRVSLLERSYVFLEDPNGRVQAVSFRELNDVLVQFPDIHHWKWFDTSVVNISEWDKNPLPLENSWIAERLMRSS